MKVAIIGCGITGMSAGITLQKAGIDTVIYEKADRPGGVIAVYKREILINNALEFVYGTAQNTFANDMWQRLGMFKKSPELKTCFTTFSWDEYAVSIYKDFDKTVNELVSISPKDKKRILKLSKSVKKFQKIEFPLVTKASDNVLRRLFRLFFNCVAAVPDAMKYGLISFKQYSKKISSPALRTFFSDVLNSDRRALQYIVLWSFFSAGNFSTPDNNQQEMVETLYNSYISCGGKVIFKSNLTDVAINNNKICALNFTDNSIFDFDYVIFSNDILSINTIMNYSGKKFPLLEKFIEKEHITSSCMLYFSLNSTEADNITDNVSISCSPFKVGSRYVNNFSVRIQQNTETAYPAISVTLYQNEKDFSEWKKVRDNSREQYNQEKNRIAQSVASSIEEYFPDIRGKLQLRDIVTPLTYYRYASVNYGGWMPESFNPLIYLKFGRGHMPGIENASIAGQKVFPIGGTTMGAFSGVKLAEKLIRNEKKNHN